MGTFKACSTCKKAIPFGSVYQACSVSTCNHVRRGLYFCSVSCWSAHVPLLRHREAWAIEKTAPLESDVIQTVAAKDEKEPTKPMDSKDPKMSAMATNPINVSNDEVLVVVSKLKAYIKASADMNTSADVITYLSDRLRKLCDQGVQRARADGRKTVMARDFV